MITRRFVISAACSYALGITLASCTRLGTLASLAEMRAKASDGELRIGYIPYYEISRDNGPDHAPSGFLVDLFKLFADTIKLDFDKVTWVSINWDSFSTLVQSGGIDFSIAGTFITPARSDKVAFTRPLFWLGNGAAVLRDDPRFKNIVDVHAFDKADIRIAVVSGEQSAEYVQREFRKAKVLQMDGPDLAAAPRAVRAGNADVAMSDQFILSRYIRSNPDLTDALASHPFSVLPIAWATSKQNVSLLQEVNPLLDRIISTSAFSRIMALYPEIPFAQTNIPVR